MVYHVLTKKIYVPRWCRTLIQYWQINAAGMLCIPWNYKIVKLYTCMHRLIWWVLSSRCAGWVAGAQVVTAQQVRRSSLWTAGTQVVTMHIRCAGRHYAHQVRRASLCAAAAQVVTMRRRWAGRTICAALTQVVTMRWQVHRSSLYAPLGSIPPLLHRNMSP